MNPTPCLRNVGREHEHKAHFDILHGQPSFTHQFKDPDEDSVALGAGVGFQFGERVYANVYYNADFGRHDDTNHVISVSATVKF